MLPVALVWETYCDIYRLDTGSTTSYQAAQRSHRRRKSRRFVRFGERHKADRMHCNFLQGAFKTKMGRPWEKELIVYGFPSKLQALQFEWAWQNPHASRHLHAAQIAPAPQGETVSSSTAAVPTPKSSAQFPKTALSNRPQSKVQVLQFMLTSKPWSAFDLRVLLFSCDAQAWWDAARHRLGPVIRTEAALKKWEKSSAEGEGPWTAEQAKRLDRVRVELREEGVDGERLVREERAIEGIGKIQIEDGELVR